MMKKFSKVNGLKINEEPKVEIKIDENETLRNEMIVLMDSILKVRATGNIQKKYLHGSISIAGKELLAEAIISILTEKDNKDKTKILESLKTKIGDWQAIDDEIEKLNTKRPSVANINRVSKLLEKYSSDEDSLILFVESTIDKFKKLDTLLDYSRIISESSISDKTKSKLTSIYNERIKQINLLV